jgi:hypothetical protein
MTLLNNAERIIMKRIAILLLSLMLILSASLVQGQAAGPALQVDANAAQHAIDPNIYGMNFADTALANAVRLPINRWGGNSTTRYNWQNDTSNHASDWYFENIPEDNANPGALPNGSAADRFISDNISTNTQTLLTIPMIGWTPKSRTAPGDPYDCGFNVDTYGPQNSIDDPWQPQCGDGIEPDGSTFITGNDPTDTSIAIGPSFVQAWMNHISNHLGAGAVHYYNLDNEPSIWHETHRDVFPIGLHDYDLRDRTYAYAAAIKATDPSALTLGPVEYGWTGYFYSGFDQSQPGNWWENPPDHIAHGDLVQWYLEQMKAYQTAHGVRILDYFDLHYYPSADGVTLSPAGDAATQARRLRTTASLWDPTYIDESWIGDPSQAIREVNLIPRMHDWVDTYYPGTKLAISEYNFGGLEHINGALTQADVLGIFGREGLDLATLWDPPTISQPGAYAFRMYRNYDGAGSGFGETSVSAISADQSKLSIYAAKRVDGALTLMIINKTGGALTSSLNVSNFGGSTVNVYRYSGANLNQIVHLPNLALSAGSLSAAYPANSITLLVLSPGDAANANPIPNYGTTPTPTLTWAPVLWAVRYDVEIASNNGFSADIQSASVTPDKLWYQATTLTPGTWYWHVRTVKTLAPLSVGAWSATQSFVIAPP